MKCAVVVVVEVGSPDDKEERLSNPFMGRYHSIHLSAFKQLATQPLYAHTYVHACIHTLIKRKRIIILVGGQQNI